MSALYPSWVFSSGQKHGNGYITKNIHIFFGISRDLIEKSLEDMAKRADAGVMPSRVTSPKEGACEGGKQRIDRAFG